MTSTPDIVTAVLVVTLRANARAPIFNVWLHSPTNASFVNLNPEKQPLSIDVIDDGISITVIAEVAVVEVIPDIFLTGTRVPLILIDDGI